MIRPSSDLNRGHSTGEAPMRRSSDAESAFVHAPIATALVDLAGRFIRVNDAFCRLLGYPSNALSEQTLRTLSLPLDADRDGADMQRLVDGAATNYQVEKRFVRADGRTIW